MVVERGSWIWVWLQLFMSTVEYKIIIVFSVVWVKANHLISYRAWGQCLLQKNDFLLELTWHSSAWSNQGHTVRNVTHAHTHICFSVVLDICLRDRKLICTHHSYPQSSYVPRLPACRLKQYWFSVFYKCKKIDQVPDRGCFSYSTFTHSHTHWDLQLYWNRWELSALIKGTVVTWGALEMEFAALCQTLEP